MKNFTFKECVQLIDDKGAIVMLNNRFNKYGIDDFFKVLRRCRREDKVLVLIDYYCSGYHNEIRRIMKDPSKSKYKCVTNMCFLSRSKIGTVSKYTNLVRKIDGYNKVELY